LFIGKLVVISHFVLQPQELGLQRCRQRFLAGLAVKIVKLEGIVHQIKQLPLILLPDWNSWLANLQVVGEFPIVPPTP